MNNGWIKLHRKVLENPIFRKDRTAWHLFETLLILADRKSGSWSGGRYQLSELCEIKADAIYKALKRLEKAKMVTLSSNNKFTTICICKWKEYQGDGNSSSNNKVTTKSQQSNTLTRSKELRIKKVNTKVLTDNRDPQVTQLIKHFEKHVGKPTRDQSLAAIQLIKQHGFEKCIGAVNAVAASRDQRYAPSIGSLEDLRDKWIKLETFWQRSFVNNKPKGVKIT